MSDSAESVEDSMFLAQKPFRFFQGMHRYHDKPPPHRTYWEEDVLIYGLAAQIKTVINLVTRLPLTAFDKTDLRLLETGMKMEVEFLLGMIGAAFCNGHTPIMCSPLKILVLEYFSPDKWVTHNLQEDAQHWTNMLENLAPWLPADIRFRNDWWNNLDGTMPPTGTLDLTNGTECVHAFREFIPAAYAHVRFYDEVWRDMKRPVIPKRQQEPLEMEKVPLFLYEILAIYWEDDVGIPRGSGTNKDIEHYMDHWEGQVERTYRTREKAMMESESAPVVEVLKAAPAHLPPIEDDDELLEPLRTAPPELPQAELEDIMDVLQNAPMEIVIADPIDEFPTAAEFQDLMDLLVAAPRDVLPASEDQSPDINVGLTAEQDLLHLLATVPSQLSEPPRDAGLSPLGGTDSGESDIFSVLRNAPSQIPLSPERLSVIQPSQIDNGLWTMRGETVSRDVMHSNGGSSGYVSDGASSYDSEKNDNVDSEPAGSGSATSDEADDDEADSDDEEESDDDNDEGDDNKDEGNNEEEEDDYEEEDEEEVVSGLLRRGSSSSVGGTEYGSDDQLYVSSN